MRRLVPAKAQLSNVQTSLHSFQKAESGASQVLLKCPDRNCPEVSQDDIVGTGGLEVVNNDVCAFYKWLVPSLTAPALPLCTHLPLSANGLGELPMVQKGGTLPSPQNWTATRARSLGVG